MGCRQKLDAAVHHHRTDWHRGPRCGGLDATRHPRLNSVSGTIEMSEAQQLQPFTFELVPSQRAAGGYHWAIRKNGKLVQRSDTPLSTEAKARTQALTMIDRVHVGQVNW